jgi:hypothetical protein
MRFHYVDPFLTCVPARYNFPAIELLQPFIIRQNQNVAIYSAQ